MNIAWIVVGFLVGWIGIDILGGIAKLRVPLTYNLACGFIGAMVAAHLVGLA